MGPDVPEWNKRRRITLSGTAVAYNVLGYGPPLVLIQGTHHPRDEPTVDTYLDR